MVAEQIKLAGPKPKSNLGSGGNNTIEMMKTITTPFQGSVKSPYETSSYGIGGGYNQQAPSPFSFYGASSGEQYFV